MILEKPTDVYRNVHMQSLDSTFGVKIERTMPIAFILG